MNIIFLDIDGVLNNDTAEIDFVKNYVEKHNVSEKVAYNAFIKKYYDVSEDQFYNGLIIKENLNNWNRLISKVDANVVLSSDWRYERNHYQDRLASLDKIKNLFKIRGIQGNVIDSTGIIRSKNWDMLRTKEIQNYLMNHDVFDKVLVIDYLSIYNQIDLKNLCNKKFLSIKTNPALGLTKEDIKKAINFFNSKD